MSKSIEQIVQKQQSFFQTNVTKDLTFRAMMLKRLRIGIKQYESEILKALKEDLNKSSMEAYMTEVGMALEELSCAERNFRYWARKRYVRTPVSQFYGTSFITPEPYGVALIMSPWNYPFLLCIAPMIGAIAAGNCCVLKPSAYSPATSSVIKRLIESCYKEEYVAVVEGGRKENSQLLEQKFDYIFFTGGVEVGKIVMTKAAAHLTPITLELGGKSPCIITKSADVKLAAKRVVFGKYLNAGQTCVAPDYVLIHESIKDEFIRYAKHYIHKMYGKYPIENENYPKIIIEKHFDRILSLIEKEQIVEGGTSKRECLKIAPTILDHITGDSKVMQEEIFGPVLPILTFHTLDEVERFVKERPKPLACYIFTTNKSVEKRLLTNLSFGGGCVNDTIIHLASTDMPFGGVGASGMGNYHGRYSFSTFSHDKSVVRKANWIDLPMRYQPIHRIKEQMVRLFLQ